MNEENFKLELTENEKQLLETMIVFIKESNVGIEAIFGWSPLSDGEIEDAFYSLMSKL